MASSYVASHFYYFRNPEDKESAYMAIKSRTATLRQSSADLVDNKLSEQARRIVSDEINKTEPFGKYIESYMISHTQDLLNHLSHDVVGQLAERIVEASDIIGEDLTKAFDEKVAAMSLRYQAAATKAAQAHRDLVSLSDELKKKHVTVFEVHHPEEIVHELEHVHKEFKRVFNTLTLGDDVMLVGAAGSGKGTLARQLAATLKPEPLPISSIRCTRDDTLSKYFGFMSSDGKHYSTSVFRERYEKGGVLLLDEIDGARAQVLIGINGALSDGYCDFPDKQVKRHKDFFVIAAANTFGYGANLQYSGRGVIDGATLNRFSVIPFDYDEDLELAIAPMPAFTRYVQTVRYHMFDRQLTYILSPRASIQGGALVLGGLDFREVEQQRVFPAWKYDHLKQISALSDVVAARDEALSQLASRNAN